MSDNLKGIDTIEIDDAVRPVRVAKTSVIGLIGTAGKGQPNKPYLIFNSRRDAEAAFGKPRNDGFTLPRALSAIYDQGGATVVAINVIDSEVHTIDDTQTATLNPNQGSLSKGFIQTFTVSDIVSLGLSRVLVAGKTVAVNGDTTDESAVVSVDSIAGIEAGMKVTGAGIPASTTVLTVGVGQVTLSAAATATGADVALTFVKDAVLLMPVGAANISVFSVTDLSTPLTDEEINALAVNTQVRVTYEINLTENVDFTLNKESGLVTRVGTSGKILRGATLSFEVTRVDDEVDAATLQSLILGNATEKSGLHAFLTAKNAVHVQPRILIAPWFTHQKPDAVTRSPIVSELEIIVNRLKAIALVDCADTTSAEAIAHRNDFANSNRLKFLFPWFTSLLPGTTGAFGTEPMSARVAGLIARVDNTEGWHNSPSNRPIYGIEGLSQQLSFALDDPDCEVNHLIQNRVSTTVFEGGFILWGNRMANGMFINKRRIADMVGEAINYFGLQFADRNINKGKLDDIVEGVNAYLRRLKNNQAIIGGTCWIDPALNTKDVLAEGSAYIDYDLNGPSPLEHLRFRQHLTDDYYEEIFQDGQPVLSL